ncbi:CCA tRNA nucleotidyltransferase [Macrococcus animalis]|uniref:CCA tRNA nucleotidyltransferase n=1 Tax=Macrococcus animalis TaxID=3395467 RepID=UPI0039BDDE4E
MKLEISQLSKETQALIRDANQVIGELYKHGYEAYIVGGAVRNILLKEDINDIDITTNCLPEDLLSIFARTVPIGIEHGTVLVLWGNNQFEVTTFRTDGEYIDHRRPEQVQFVSDLKSDLERRDFTINALAINDSFDIIDYFDGQNDLINKQIRAVGIAEHRFQEDALRIIRAIRFQSVLDFEIEEHTLQAIHKLATTIKYVSIERIVVEMKKLLQGKGIEKALKLFYQTIYAYVPFFKSLKGDTEAYQFHSSIEFNIYIAYIIYCEQKFGHDLISQISTLKLSNQDKKNIKDLVTIFDHLNNPKMTKKAFVYRFDLTMIQTVNEFIQAEGLFFDNLMDSQETKHIYRQLPIHSRDDININGNILINYLQKKPGPWLKTLINTIEIEVIEGRLDNQQETILEWAKQHV